MAVLSMPLLWAIASFLTLSIAQQVCPTQAPSGACTEATFKSVLTSAGASIENISIVPPGGCYREAPGKNIAYGTADNYAANVGGSCAMIVKRGSYRFGLLLPSNSTWKGSFLAVGNYAFAGGIHWKNMGIGPSTYGMATMSTDTGHNSTGSDMSWAKGNTQAQEDWGFRAMNGSVAIAKQLTNAFYGTFNRKLSFSYFSGCSTGGRQGLKQIQVDPNSFNGVLVGAPAWEQYGLMPWIAKIGLNYSNAGDNGNFNQNQWTAMVVQIRAACDGNDGALDDIISRPDLCNFDTLAPDYLQCGGQFSLTPPYCLNENQIPTAAQFYKDYIIGGDTVFHAPELGSEVDLGYLPSGYLAVPNPTNFDQDWAKDFLGKGDTYQYSDELVAEARAKNPGQATVDNFTLNTFSQNRGKLVLYQGLADGVVPAKGTTRYYDNVKAQTNNIDSFMRYFQVPGMHHCFVSDTDNSNNAFAPWFFGGDGQANQVPPYVTPSTAAKFLGKPEFDAFEALRQWVESAAANPSAPGPASLTATTWYTGNQTVWRQRPLCPYPKRAVFAGGSVNDKNSWSCQDG